MPTIIEKDRAVCTKISNQLDSPVIHGDGTTLEGLENAGVAQADILVAVTGKDEDNLIACQLGKRHFGVPRTVARINNPRNAKVLRMLGVDITISATDNIARLLEREIDTAAIKQLVPLNQGTASLSEIRLPDNYIYDGITLSQLKIPDESIIVSISRNGEFIIPRGNTQLFSNDSIITIAKNEVIHKLSAGLGLESK